MIKDSNTVVYFTHDYFSEVPEKNEQLLQTAEICKAYNIPKVLAVNPMEYVNYYNDDSDADVTKNANPLNQEAKAHEQAM